MKDRLKQAERLRDLAIAPSGPTRRVAFTRSGVTVVEIDSRFDEQIIDLHWRATLAGALGNDADLQAFAGIVVGGHPLVASFDEFLSRCVRWAA